MGCNSYSVHRPPAETQTVLDDINQQTFGVLAQFKVGTRFFSQTTCTDQICQQDLLTNGQLNQLQCKNPDEPSGSINLQTMVIKYRNMYWLLQQDTAHVVKDLQAYSTLSLNLLPKLVSGTGAMPGQVKVASYLTASQTIAVEYKTKADDLFKRRYVVSAVPALSGIG